MQARVSLFSVSKDFRTTGCGFFLSPGKPSPGASKVDVSGLKRPGCRPPKADVSSERVKCFKISFGESQAAGSIKEGDKGRLVRPSLTSVQVPPSHPPSLLPSFLPFFLSSFLPSHLPSVLPSFLPSFLPSVRPSLLPSFLHLWLREYLNWPVEEGCGYLHSSSLIGGWGRLGSPISFLGCYSTPVGSR